MCHTMSTVTSTAGYWPRPWTCEDGGPRRWGCAGVPGLAIAPGFGRDVYYQSLTTIARVAVAARGSDRAPLPPPAR